ncbi:tetratricopeptide repeat protein [Halalkalibacterium halodurans]|uniref:tetratricopeptide repeat protein n=1 Tax=Halalkalibacterium halodurans TaxID=86665 RepID=UPI002E1CBE1B|nr:tetratricopeptide repeat protein [Halalkalibacterium halodurans]
MLSERTKLDVEWDRKKIPYTGDVVSHVLKVFDQKKSKDKNCCEDKVWVLTHKKENRIAIIEELKQHLVNNIETLTIGGVWETTGYSGIATQLRTIITYLLKKGYHNFLETFAPEIIYLFPDLTSVPPFRNAKQLDAIALSPSRRRLHKESEQMFRVTQMVVSLLLKYVEHTGKDVVFLFDQIDKMDEHTIRCFTRLSKCIHHCQAVVVATFSEASDNDPRFNFKINTDNQPYISLAENRNRLLHTAHKQTSPLVLEPTLTNDLFHKKNTIIASEKNTQLMTKEVQTTTTLLESIHKRKLDNLDSEVIDALEESIFTQNYEHALFLINKTSPYMDHLKNKTKVEVWIYIGIGYAFMLKYEKALTLFQYALKNSEDTLQKSEIQLLIALLYTKRLNNPLLGREIIDNALQNIGSLTGNRVEVERTWLYNLKALTFVERRDLVNAYKNCRKALEHIKKGDRSEDAIHIKINLLSNISVLYEYMNKVDASLTKWMKFDKFILQSSPVFTKHYLYRKAGLLYKMKNYLEAIEALKASYKIAAELHDYFHMDIIARGLGAILFEEENFSEAIQWFRCSLNAKYKLLVDEDIPRVVAAIAICFNQLGESQKGMKEIEACLQTHTKGDAAQMVLDMLTQWEHQDNDKWKSYVKWAIQKPDSKLNRPFDLTNLYCERTESS